MKLHLPTMLRRALLACFAAVSSVTFATGSAWADTYDLLVSDAGWVTARTCTITPGAEGTISGGGWSGPHTATYTQDVRYSYLVDAENTFRFTLGYVSSSIPDKNSATDNDGVLTFAFVGVNENTTILLGTEKYGSTTISYGTTTDTTSSNFVYDGAAPELTAFSKDGVNVTRAENMQYTLSGTVSLNAEGKYVLELSLEDTNQTYTAASSVVLGDSFDFNKFILSSNGDTFTLNQFDITGTQVDNICTATISGQTQAADAAWSSATGPIAYDSIPMTDGSAVLGLMAGGDNAEITFEAGTHLARIEVGGNLTITGAGGLQVDELRVDSGVQVAIGSDMVLNTFAADDLGENGVVRVKNGAYLDLTAVDSNVVATDYEVLNSTKIATEAGAYVKMAFNHKDNQSELKLTQNVTQAYNIEAVGAMMIHGNGTANSFSYTIGSGKSLIANGTSHGATGLYAINHGTIIISGGSVETSKLTLGHSSSNNDGAYWGKLTMTDGTLKIGNLTLRQNHNDVFSVTGGELEFTSATALTRGSNTRATITIQGSGAGDSERVTLKSATSAWALDGAGLTTAPTIGNATVAAAQDISLSNVALSGAIVKQGAGQLVLNTVNTDALSSMDIQEGFVQAGAALTLNNLTVSNGAGFAYDISGMTEETAAAITATNYSGALTIKLLGASAGTYKLANVSGAMSGDDVTFVGLSDRMQATATVAADGLLSVTLDAGVAMDLTWDVAGPSNEWASSGDTNWDAAGSDAAFINGDNVTFAGEGEEITVSGTVAPNNMTVSGTGYVFEGGSIAATGKLTVAASADAHIKSQASFAGGVEVNGTLTITDTTTAQHSQSALGTISGAGNVVLNLRGSDNGFGFDFSGMTGGAICVQEGHLQVNQSNFNTAADATLPTIQLSGTGNNSGDLVFNATSTLANNVELVGDASHIFHVNSATPAIEATVSGTVSGANGNLSKSGGGNLTFSNTLNIASLSTASGGEINILANATFTKEYDKTTFSGAGLTINHVDAILNIGNGAQVSVDKFDAIRGTINIGTSASDTAYVTAASFEASDEQNGLLTLNIADGSTLKITGADDTHYKTTAIILGQWNMASQVTVSGNFIAENAAITFGDCNVSDQNTFISIDGGTVAVQGIRNHGSNVNGTIELNLSNDGKLILGAQGLSTPKNFVSNIGKGTIGMSADSLTIEKALNLTSAEGTTFDTAIYSFSADPSNPLVRGTEGGTMKLNGELSGSGKLIKAGSGTLEIGAATTTLADVSIQEGFVQTGADAATISTLTVAAGTGFAYDLAAGQKKVVAESFDGPITLKLLALADGTFELMQGAAGLDESDVTFDYTAGSRVSVEKSVENGLVKLEVSIAGTPLDNLVWNTGHADNVWAVGGATNWTSDGSAEQFLNGDSVTFSGSGETISISGTVAPQSITVTGTGYVLEGSGSIEGTGSLTVRNGGELTIVSANSYTGGTTIEEGGVLVVKHVQAIGEGSENGYIRAFSGSGTMAFNTGGSVKLNGDVLADFSGTLELRSGSLRTYNVSTNELAKAINLNLAPGTSINTDSGGLNVSGTVRFNLVAINDGIPEYDKEGTFTFNNYWGSDMRLSGLVEGDGIVKINPTWTDQSLSLLNNNNTFAGTYKVQIGSSNADWSDQSAALILGAQYAAKDATVELVAEAERLARLRLDTSATVKSLKSAVSDKNVVTSSVVATLTVTEGDFGGSIQNGSDANVLSLTKQGAADTTLILRGANTYTGVTTINGGTLELAAGAELASELVTVAGGAVLAVNEGIYASTYVDGTGTIEKRGEAAGDYVDLAGLADTFAGTIDVQGGNLRLGDTLEIKTGRTLKVGANGAYLNNALTLSGGKLALDYTTAADAEATMLNLSENALTLLTGNTLSLSGLVLADTTTQANTIDLFTGVGSVLGSDGNALSLTDALASTYFSTIEGLGADVDTSTLGLQLADGKLQLVIPEQTHYLVWDENKANDTWAAGTQFGDEAQDTFTTDADVKFGALTAESETVSISGAVAAGKVLIDGGEGKTYVFAPDDDASGIAAAESITVNSGTACFWEGSLDMTADTTLAVNDGATLLLNNGAIANAAAVDIELNNGSTLEWNAGNTTDYSASMSVADGATVSLVSSGGASVALTAGSLNAAGETATVNLSGGNFKMDAASVYGNVVIGSGISVELMRSDDSSFAQNFSGDGGITVVSEQGIRRLSGTNTYKGATALNGRLIIEGAQALSEYTTFTGTDALCLATAAGEDSAEYTINRAFNTGAQKTYVGRNQGDFDSKGAVTGVTLNLGSSATLLGTVYVRSSNTMNVAAGATIGGTIDVEADATLTLEAALANQIQGAGTVKIDGTDITWDNTNKIYTGETQVLAGSTLTAAAPLTSGTTKGKVQLLEDGAMIITNSTDWANKVYGAGTLVLVNGVNNLDAIVDGAATDTLATAYVGMPVQTYGTTDVDGVLTIDDAAAAAAAAKITDLVVNAGSSVNVSTTGDSLKIGQNLTLSGAGDAAATAGTAEAAALAITTGSGETKISSNITLAADTTIYAGGTGDHRLNGSFNGAGYTLTKTGSGWLGLGAFASGSTNDLSGDLVIQGGTVELVGMGAADARQAIGYTSLAAGTTLRFFSGHYSFAEGMNISGNATINVGTGPGNAYVGGNVTGSGIVTLNGGSGVLTLAAANDFAGTWKLMADARTLELDHADAAKAAVLQTGDGGKIKLAAGSTTYNVVALTSTGTAGEILTDGTTTRTIAINNTTGTEAAFGAYVHGEVDVQLLGGVQKFSGTLEDGSDFEVQAGTLKIASTGQSGTHSFTATGGVLDMTGYTRAASATGADTIYAVGGQVVGLNLGAGMVLTGTSDAAAAMETITLGGSTVLGAGQMNFRVADSTNMIPGTENPYKRANTLYVVGAETGDTISLAGGGAKTLLNLSITNALTEILDPTEENAGDGYRDHTLISGLTLADTSAVASDFFATNLDGQDTGSTSYSLHFVQNAGNNALYDLVLRAMGAADTLFWNDTDGGTWEAADQTPDSWVKAQMVDGTLTPGTTTADFEQLDYVVFDDLTDGAGAAVTDVTITVAGAGVNIGSMTVQADTTNYTIGGGAISSTAGNTGATLTKTGTGTLTLTGANSYAGNTTISGGTLIAQNDAALSNTMVDLAAGTLVLDFQNAGTDGELDAVLLMKGGNTLKAMQDATVRYATSGNLKTLLAATGKTLTLKPSNTDGTPGTSIAGQLNINNGTGMTGTIKLALENSKTYTHNSHAVVYAGKYEISGGTDTRLNMQELKVAEGAEAYVKGGMTLQVTYLEGPQNKGYGKLVLEDASKLVYANASANHSKTLGNAIEAEGSVLEIGGANAATTTLTLKQGGLTLKGTETNAAADTTLSGGTWVLEQGAVSWDAAATGALKLAANTTVKVNDDTMKKLVVDANNAELASAKADGSAAALSVESINVGKSANGGRVNNVNLTLTGTGSYIRATVADVTVNQAADAITGEVDLTATALEFGSSGSGDVKRAYVNSLTITSGKVYASSTLSNVVHIVDGEIELNGVNALLDLDGAKKFRKNGTNNNAATADILIHAGSIAKGNVYDGQITIDDLGVAQTISLDKVGSAASILLKDAETSNGVTKLTGLWGVKLADGSAFDLTANLADGAGNVLFDFADDAATDAAVSAATGATVSIGVNGVLGDVLDAGSVSYTIADKSIAPLASAVAWDATLALYNISATFGTDGKLTLSAVDVPLSDDDIYRSSEDNVGADGTQWAGNGPNVYSSSEPYASVYIDKDTVIDLTQAAAGEGDGLVLSNLIGRGNGANLTITGDGNDLVTINNNLEVADVDSNLRSLSFNGDIDVTGTELQLLNTVATPGAQDAGDLDTDSVYQINGALTADADSPVTITSGILKLNGKGSNASELLGGVTVENETGWLQVSGEASIGGTLQVSDELGVRDMTGDLELLSGGKVTLLDGAVVDNGFGIKGAGEGKETLSIAKGATATLSEVSHVQDVVLELQEGSTLVMNVDENTNKYGNAVEVDGLTGTGDLQGASSAAGYWPHVHITPQQDCSFSGDLSGYDGFIHVYSGKGTQTFDKVTTAADSEVELQLAGKSVINVAEENGNKTLNLRILKLLDGSDTTVEMNTDSGSPAIRINRSSATMEDGAALTLSSAAGEVLSADDDLLFMEGTGQMSDLDGKSITLDITDNAFRRLSETAKLVVEGDKVYVDLAASETNRYEEGASDPNAKAGAELLWNVNPSKLPADSALKAIDNAVAELMQNGNRDAAERALAATAGAGTAVLGSAFSADVERQLRAIRNRTTTMGVNQCEVNEGMPYVNAWINAEGDHREMDADGLAAGYTMDSWGGTVGFDVDITNHLTMGMAVTAMYGDLEADSADRAEGDFDTQYVSLFARVAHQAWTHTFVATLGRADVTLNRTVSVPGGSYETSGDTDGMAYGFMYEVARTFSLSEDGTTCWQPVFNVAWRHSSIDAYTESGADNALAVGEQDMNVLTFGAGARLQTVMGESLYNRASIFEARAMVKVDAGDREGEADVALLEGTTAASVKSAEIGAVGVEIGAGVTIPVGLNAGSIFIDGSAEFRSGYSNVNGTVGYRINF